MKTLGNHWERYSVFKCENQMGYFNGEKKELINTKLLLFLSLEFENLLISKYYILLLFIMYYNVLTLTEISVYMFV